MTHVETLRDEHCSIIKPYYDTQNRLTILIHDDGLHPSWCVGFCNESPVLLGRILHPAPD